jgi:geranylgeranyl diphosphate synthase type I
MKMRPPSVLERFRAEIDTELKSVLMARPSPLYDMLRYHLGWVDQKGNRCESAAGKALRPTLCLLACAAAGADYHRALPAAAAIELLHNFSLIHDDIQDDDRERRHRPTVWAVWGKPQAINAGTAMRILTNVALSRLAAVGVGPEKRLLVQQLLDETTLRLIEGQYLDISYEERLDIGVTDYLKMIEGKTASLIACSLEVGAWLGADDRRLAEGFRTLGWNLGLGFQIRDDILGIWGNPVVTGKPLGSDIQRRKKTLPVVHALETARDGYKEVLVGFYQNGHDHGSVAEVLSILGTVGAQAYARKMADGYCRQARRIIGGLGIDAAARRDLEELVDFLEERNY